MKNLNVLMAFALALVLLFGCAAVSKPKETTQGPPQDVVPGSTPSVQTPGVAKLDMAILIAQTRILASGGTYAAPYLRQMGDMAVYRKDNSRFFTYDFASSKETEVPLTYDYDADYSVAGQRAYLTPAPSNTVIYIATNSKAGKPVGDMFLVGADGSRLVRLKASDILVSLASAYPAAGDAQFASLSMSFNGNRGAYLASVTDKGGNKLDQVIGTTDRSSYNLLTMPDKYPAEGEPLISANGERILFKDGSSDLFASDFAGTQIVKLSSSAGAFAVSGDGKVVAFFKKSDDSNGKAGLYSSNADGTSMAQLVASTQIGDITSIALNGDGSELLFTGKEAGAKGHQAYHYAQTKVLTRLTDFSGTALLDQLSASADLKKMLFIYAGEGSKGTLYYAER
ncbi:MAG: hypothetical protein WC759_00540 [Candidatus Micrarchaeia archaeon]